MSSKFWPMLWKSRSLSITIISWLKTVLYLKIGKTKNRSWLKKLSLAVNIELRFTSIWMMKAPQITGMLLIFWLNGLLKSSHATSSMVKTKRFLTRRCFNSSDSTDLRCLHELLCLKNSTSTKLNGSSMTQTNPTQNTLKMKTTLYFGKSLNGCLKTSSLVC